LYLGCKFGYIQRSKHLADSHPIPDIDIDSPDVPGDFSVEFYLLHRNKSARYV
jgi:hypothetical protein